MITPMDIRHSNIKRPSDNSQMDIRYRNIKHHLTTSRMDIGYSNVKHPSDQLPDGYLTFEGSWIEFFFADRYHNTDPQTD